MKKRSSQAPQTRATEFLKEHRVPFATHLYPYQAHGGTRASADNLGIDEHVVIKTLVMEDEKGKPLIVLMHGDCSVSTKALARQIGCKQVSPCRPDVANRHSGYLVGGTSPFGTRKAMPIYAESSVLELAEIFINGGKRGFLVSIDPKKIREILDIKPVNCALRD